MEGRGIPVSIKMAGRIRFVITEAAAESFRHNPPTKKKKKKATRGEDYQKRKGFNKLRSPAHPLRSEA